MVTQRPEGFFIGWRGTMGGGGSGKAKVGDGCG